jgi:CheY-like chemotaxis protein
MPEDAEVEGKWHVLLVEDDEDVRRQVREFLTGEEVASRKLQLEEIPDLPSALDLIRERKADLVILDVYKGQAKPGGEQVGIQILESIKLAGFVPVVLYTALPEGLEEYRSTFVRLVSKDADGLPNLRREIEDLFRLRVPQLFRAIVNHLDQALSSYMWGFVQEHLKEFEPIIDKPEFLRLILQRLGMTFARKGIEKMVEDVYGVPAPGVANSDNVHPAEYYVKPPIGEDPLLGDIRVRSSGGQNTYLVVLWPSCDMVSVGGRTPKTDRLLCGRASRAEDTAEVAEWARSQTGKTKEAVIKLIKNARASSPERYHFLPAVWDIPALVVDFQALEHLSLEEVKNLTCVGTVASPFAEALGTRFQRYVGRPGTPDLDVEAVLKQFTPP